MARKLGTLLKARHADHQWSLGFPISSSAPNPAGPRSRLSGRASWPTPSCLWGQSSSKLREVSPRPSCKPTRSETLEVKTQGPFLFGFFPLAHTVILAFSEIGLQPVTFHKGTGPDEMLV